MEKDLTGSDDPIIDGIDDKQKKDVVSFESHQTLLKQRKADQEKLKTTLEKLKALEDKEAELASKEAKLEEEKLRSEGNWKQLLESREARAKELEEKNRLLSEKVQSFEDKFTNAAKINAFNSQIGGALKMNEYYSFVDTSKIALDPETGAVDESSLKSYANEFIAKHKDLIAFRKGSSLPSDAPSHNSGSQISHAEWLKIAETNPAEARKRMKDVK